MQDGREADARLFQVAVKRWLQAPVIGVAAQGQFVGLDQVNALIPRDLIGAGEVEVRMTVDGRLANVVTITVQ